MYGATNPTGSNTEKTKLKTVRWVIALSRGRSSPLLITNVSFTWSYLRPKTCDDCSARNQIAANFNCMGNVLERIQLTVHVKFCGHIICCCFLQREIGARRRLPCAEYMVSVLMNYHIGSGILPPQKTEWNLIAGEDSYLEERTLYIRGDGVLVLTESPSTKIKFWSRSGPKNKDLIKDVPWILEAP